MQKAGEIGNDSFFGLACLVLTIAALQNLIASLPHVFRMLGHRVFPSEKHGYPHQRQRDTEKVKHHPTHREHHKMTPIINTAIHTAFTVHNNQTERAVK